MIYLKSSVPDIGGTCQVQNLVNFNSNNFNDNWQVCPSSFRAGKKDRVVHEMKWMNINFQN